MRLKLPCLACGLLLAACARVTPPPPVAEAQTPAQTVKAAVSSPEFPTQNIDSLALWRAPRAQDSLLLVTGKESDTIEVLNPATGALLRSIGKTGSGPGEFRRPNGIAVIDNFVLVVERDNHRVQVLRLPGLTPVGTFGQKELKKPYGIAWYRKMDKEVIVYVTDDYNAASLLGGEGMRGNLDKRVKKYWLNLGGSELKHKLLRNIGPTGNDDVALFKVESIEADAANDRLFICDEEQDRVKIYTLKGDYAGEVPPHWVHGHDTEGLAIVKDAKDATRGWLVVTEQGPSRTCLHVYSRDGQTYLGAVTGDPVLANTDGICLSAGDLGDMRGGALFAVHDDRQVFGYSWDEVLNAVRAK